MRGPEGLLIVLKIVRFLEMAFYSILIIIPFVYLLIRGIRMLLSPSLENLLMSLVLFCLALVSLALVTELASWRYVGWERFFLSYSIYRRRQEFERHYPNRYQEENYRKEEKS